MELENPITTAKASDSHVNSPCGRSTNFRLSRIRQRLRNVFPNSVSVMIEDIFFHVGKCVATYSKSFIFGSILAVFLCSIGLIGIKTENRAYKLWIPESSDFHPIKDWVNENFPQKYKLHKVLAVAENILDKNVLLELLHIHEILSYTKIVVDDNIPNVSNNTEPRSISYQDKCAKIPVFNSALMGRKKREAGNDFEKENDNRYGRTKRQTNIGWVSHLPESLYCNLISESEKRCFEISLLEIWGFNKTKLENLSQEQIIEDVNSAAVSAVFGYRTNFSEMLGGVERDESGKIIKAKASFYIWATEDDPNKVIPGKFVEAYFSGKEADVEVYRWEKAILKILEETSEALNYTKVYLCFSQTFDDVSKDTQDRDRKVAVVGYVVVFFYIQVMLGKLNAVEARPFLSLCGLLSVVMSVGVSYGLCVIFGLMNTVVNTILPFLLLALGIDDMFVIMQAFNNLSEQELSHDLPTRIGFTLRRAGASITITSATDIVAFGIGALTTLPALRSFCFYAAIGIISVYLLQITFFSACLKFDQMRIEAKRHAILLCVKQKNWQPSESVRKSFCQLFLQGTYSKFILHPIIKKLIVIVSLTFFGISCWGMSNLEQKFDPLWFLPSGSNTRNYFELSRKMFPETGPSGHIYLSNLTFPEDIQGIDYIVSKLQSQQGFVQRRSWYIDFKNYVSNRGYDLLDPDMSEDDFLYDLGNFLFSPSGFKYQNDLIFESSLKCGDPAPKVISIDIKYDYSNPGSHGMESMEFVRSVAKESNISFASPFSYMHVGWENDAIIQKELYVNLSLAVFAIFCITLTLISSLVQSLLVLSCVIMTLVEVGALMYWWGLTIDGAASINLIIAVGLCVDYSTHICRYFILLE